MPPRRRSESERLNDEAIEFSSSIDPNSSRSQRTRRRSSGQGNYPQTPRTPARRRSSHGVSSRRNSSQGSSSRTPRRGPRGGRQPSTGIVDRFESLSRRSSFAVPGLSPIISASSNADVEDNGEGPSSRGNGEVSSHHDNPPPQDNGEGPSPQGDEDPSPQGDGEGSSRQDNGTGSSGEASHRENGQQDPPPNLEGRLEPHEDARVNQMREQGKLVSISLRQARQENREARQEEQLQCGICCGDYGSERDLGPIEYPVKLLCNHIFGRGCAETIITTERIPRCPNCRRSMEDGSMPSPLPPLSPLRQQPPPSVVTISDSEDDPEYNPFDSPPRFDSPPQQGSRPPESPPRSPSDVTMRDPSGSSNRPSPERASLGEGSNRERRPSENAAQEANSRERRPYAQDAQNRTVPRERQSPQDRERRPYAQGAQNRTVPRERQTPQGRERRPYAQGAQNRAVPRARQQEYLIDENALRRRRQRERSTNTETELPTDYNTWVDGGGPWWYEDYKDRVSADPPYVSPPPENFVSSIDRSDGRIILKKVIGCFEYSFGEHLLLESPSRREAHREYLRVYDLEAQSEHPGVKEKFLRNNSMTLPADISLLDGYTFQEIGIKGVASVKQNLREMHDVATNRFLQQVPRRNPFTRLALGPNDDGDGLVWGWFHQGEVERKYGANRVKDLVKYHRQRVGQAEQQLLPRRNGPSPIPVREISPTVQFFPRSSHERYVFDERTRPERRRASRGPPDQDRSQYSRQASRPDEGYESFEDGLDEFDEFDGFYRRNRRASTYSTNRDRRQGPEVYQRSRRRVPFSANEDRGIPRRDRRYRDGVHEDEDHYENDRRQPNQRRGSQNGRDNERRRNENINYENNRGQPRQEREGGNNADRRERDRGQEEYLSETEPEEFQSRRQFQQSNQNNRRQGQRREETEPENIQPRRQRRPSQNDRRQGQRREETEAEDIQPRRQRRQSSNHGRDQDQRYEPNRRR